MSARITQSVVNHNGLLGQQLEITGPEHGVQVQFDGKTLWVNVDGVMRLRIGHITVPVEFELPMNSDGKRVMPAKGLRYDPKPQVREHEEPQGDQRQEAGQER